MTAAYLLTIVFVKVSVLLFVSFLALAPGASFAAAQPPAVPASPSSTAELERHRSGESTTEAPEMFVQVEQLTTAAVRLPMAAILACVLAVRPRRRGTPERQAPVIQTQIILAIVGAVVMLVVGSSLARAFGIVGAAGLVRYRSKIEDPKDAGVMLSTLAIGLASGGAFLHVSLDMDVVDPEQAPGVGTPVRGGITYREAHLGMEILAKHGVVSSLEVVEVNPVLDEHNATASLAVELVCSALGARIL